MRDVRLYVGPGRPWLRDAALEGGARLVDLDGPNVGGPSIDDRAAATTDIDAVVWTDPRDADGLAELLRAHPEVDWVQLPWAGIEPFLGVLDHERRWTSGKDVYSEPVAELALAGILAGLRGLIAYGRADRWSGPIGSNLSAAHVVIVGGGGITRALLTLLAPFGARTTVVRRAPDPVPGATATVGADALDDVLPDADVVVLALALTPATERLLDARRLALLRPSAWLVNVARGAHVDTDALDRALADGALGGAVLDVTDPEPLPDDHPLWRRPTCLITPHIGNTPEMARPLLSRRVRENVERYRRGEPLIGVVDVDQGY